jgi:hypothetical protein
MLDRYCFTFTFGHAMLDDAAFERQLYPPSPSQMVQRPLPDWPFVHRELKRPGVTLLLWEE